MTVNLSVSMALMQSPDGLLVRPSTSRSTVPGSSVRGAPYPAPAIVLRNVVSVVGGFPVLAGVDLDLSPGEVVLLTGANGAGKTSLLRVIAGLAPVTSGEATAFGCDLARPPRAHRGRVVFVGGDAGCYGALTVRRNLELYAGAARLAPADLVAAAIDIGLGPQLDVPFGRLSTGQRQRCALAIGLARRADVVLLDEPHSGLDARGRDLIDRTVIDAAAHGAIVVVVSHEVERARRIATAEVVVSGGLCGSKKEIA